MEILKLDIEAQAAPPLSEREVWFQVGLLSALACVAASFVARFVFGAPLVPELTAQFIFSVAPISLVEVAVGLLGPFAKRLAFLGCVGVYTIALTAAAIGFLKFNRKPDRPVEKRLALALFSVLSYAVTLFIIIPLLGGGLSGRYLRQGAASTAVSLAFVFGAYGAALYFISKFYEARPEAARANSHRLGRRGVMRGVAYAVVAVAVYTIGSSLVKEWWSRGAGRVRGGTGVFPEIDNLALEITPTTDFYEVSKNPFDPQVDAARWRLEVAGNVESPYSLGLDELRELPSTELYATLECIDNKVGGELIGNALWRGVRLKDLLARAGLKEGVKDVVLRASDDYADSIPLDRALADYTLLAYEMNGEPLSAAHGYPLRLIVPGIFGMKNVKWVERIEAVNYDFKGYWQRRGWDDRALYKTMSRIDAPHGQAGGRFTVAGIAFAGDRGVSRVEVSTDGGKSWSAAEIKEPLSRFSWVLWHKQLDSLEQGERTIVVRATDGTGETQT
ncbi:MAG TPA: molybdopterin-dependent oxidoreductase, partial [Blastocatellia bacterium]|nr:molybdopterin-dependent oxidoreductase [Blastocatellia bacterium]